MKKNRDGRKKFPPVSVSRRVLLAAAAGAVVAQLERGALGVLAVADAALAAAHLDLVEGAVGVLVISAAVDGALDAGVGLVKHNHFLLVYRDRTQRQYGRM